MTVATATPTGNAVPIADGSGHLASGWMPNPLVIPSVVTPFAIKDGTDNTKQLSFDISGTTTGTTLTLKPLQTGNQTLQVPSISGTDTLATLGLNQTWTGLPTFGAGATVKTPFTVEDATDATKQWTLSLSAMTTGKVLTMHVAQTTSQTLNYPNIAATDTLATLGLAQTFSALNTFSAGVATTTLSASDQITSTVTTGTAPLVVASTTQVANLNASTLIGSTWASPGAVGSTTPSTGAFTTLSATGVTSLGSTAQASIDASGNISTTGNIAATAATATITAGSNTATAPRFTVNGAAATARGMTFDTAAGLRWFWYTDSDAESGSNAGSSQGLSAYDDSGSFIDTPLYVTRAAGGKFAIARPTTIAPSVATSGTQNPLTITTAANTGQTASTEISAVNFNCSATRTWAAGAIATQREVLIQAPTYAFASASTVTNAATLAITGAPIAGSGATLTSSWALWVQAGQIQFGSASTGMTFNNGNWATTGGSQPVTITQAAVNAAVRYTFQATPGSQTLIPSGTESPQFIWGAHTNQWATSTPTTQREWEINAPTYSCDTAAQTITTAATVAITGAPIAGTNVTLTNAYALWVQSGGVLFQNTLVTNGNITSNGTSGVIITQATAAGGTRQALTITPAANTSIASGTESPAVQFNSATRQWATSTPTTQEEWKINAPTYACDTASQTITTAATFAIQAGPSAGTNVTITNSYALWVRAGISLFAGQIKATGTSSVNIAQTAGTSASPIGLSYTGGAHTTLASGTECNDVLFNLARTVQFATSTPTTQRAFYIQAPTYSCDTASQTITTAATLAISGAPVAGANVTITNAFALLVSAGQARFTGGINVAAANIVSDTSTGTKIGTATNQKIGFFNATPVVQPASPSGNTHTPTIGAATTVFVNTTFDGSIGSTAYTIGDIVIALKNLGLLAQ